MDDAPEPIEERPAEPAPPDGASPKPARRRRRGGRGQGGAAQPAAERAPSERPKKPAGERSGGGRGRERQGDRGKAREGDRGRGRERSDAPRPRPQPTHNLRLEVGGRGVELHCDTCDLVVGQLAAPQVRSAVEQAHRQHQGELSWESGWVGVCRCGWRSGKVGQDAARKGLDDHINGALRAAASGQAG